MENIRKPPGRPATPPQHSWLGYPRHQAVLTEEVADLEGVVPSEADRHLVQVYGDHIHQNDG